MIHRSKYSETVRKAHPRKSKQYSSRGNSNDLCPFVAMQDLSSLLEHVPAQDAECYTTYMMFFNLTKGVFYTSFGEQLLY